ncbi:hypothetical protein RO3G_06193 [Rhizopus delemar RA 99-880]|uniref:Uncharacterized protein n=3 Tax=Rhizopus TaxID=4842 RepID=I1BZ58_RHIO9|nr:hypothetical protein RO3G_06193 [Rhizopus delemar RA 99-880]|eukprot:EIE81488.1 hypothetical protein RO3G_06193 [Rhizopus delemar RA 99-880]
MTSIQRGLKSSKTTLSSEQINHLNNQFASTCRLLVCQSCNKTDSLNRNGSTAGDYPQPCFICKFCSKAYNTHNVVELVENASKASQNFPLVMDDIEISQEPVSNSDNNINASKSQVNIEALLATIQQLTAEFQQAKAEIKELHNQIARQPNQQWLLIQILNSLHWVLPPKYLLPAHVPVGQLRSRLRRLDINNSHVLDSNYPAHNVVALLVHNDYAPELKEHLKKFKVQAKEDFDQCDGSIPRDPKYKNSSKEERDNTAYMHHCNRMERTLTYIHPPAKFAVARYFYEQDWIGKPIFDEIVTSHRPQFAEPLYIEEDDEMDTEDRLGKLSEL